MPEITHFDTHRPSMSPLNKHPSLKAANSSSGFTQINKQDSRNSANLGDRPSRNRKQKVPKTEHLEIPS